MSFLADAFEGGRDSWAAAGQGEKLLPASIYSSVRHEGTQFVDTSLAGSTVRNAYFVDCLFERCDLSNLAFESCDLTRCEFRDCVGAAVRFVDGRLLACEFLELQVDELHFSRVSVVGATFGESTVGQLEFSHVPDLQASFLSCEVEQFEIGGSGPVGVAMRAVQAQFVQVSDLVGTVRLEECRLDVLTLQNAGSANLELVDIILRDVRLDGCDALGISAVRSVIFGAELNHVHLDDAVFVECALVSCTWPRVAGRTTLRGKFVAPDGLLSQPVGDIAGIDEATRREIQRSQYLSLLEDRTAGDWPRFALHRLVGATTGHGRSPLRIVGAAGLFAVLAALLGMCIRELGNLSSQIGWRSSLASLPDDWWGYLGIVVGLRAPADVSLVPGVEMACQVASLVFLGIIITLLAEFVFRPDS